MKTVCWVLIILGVVAFAVGAFLAFGAGRWTFLLTPQGYWRGAMGFLALAIALRLMEEKR